MRTVLIWRALKGELGRTFRCNRAASIELESANHPIAVFGEKRQSHREAGGRNQQTLRKRGMATSVFDEFRQSVGTGHVMQSRSKRSRAIGGRCREPSGTGESDVKTRAALDSAEAVPVRLGSSDL